MKNQSFTIFKLADQRMKIYEADTMLMKYQFPSVTKLFFAITVLMLYVFVSVNSYGQQIASGEKSEKANKDIIPEGKVPSYTAKLSKNNNQLITGWGCFPGWVDQGGSIGKDKKVQDLIYRDLGMTVARIKIYPNYCNKDGSLNTLAIDTNLARQIETMRAYGITKWIVTTWSPPLFMKKYEIERGNQNGEPNRLKPEFEDAFVKYYTQIISYLRDIRKLGIPEYVTIQNEPDFAASWDGCKYDSLQWQRVTKKLRKSLNDENLSQVKINGPDHNHNSVTKYLSALTSDPELLKATDGIAFHSYSEGNQSGSKAAIAARDLILKYKKDLKPGAEVWQTEFSTTKREDLTISAIHHLQSMMRDIGYLEANCYIYWLGSSDRRSYAGEELIFGRGPNMTITKLYYVYKKLWNTVVPGSFYVKTFSGDDDPDLSNFGPDPMDMIAFVSKGKTVVLMTNATAVERNMTIKGLAGKKMTIFRTSATEDMKEIGTQSIVRGATTVSLPGNSILMLETNGGQ